jgi:hypothetical protein
MVPSWSWASSLGPVEYDTHTRSCYFGLRDPEGFSAKVMQPLVELKDIRVITIGEDTFGSIEINQHRPRMSYHPSSTGHTGWEI